MNLKIKNIGIVKQADVRLDGLTVIAGENDTGKSTVGKLMFAIVKAVSRYEQDLNESKENDIRRIIEEIFLYVRRTKDFPSQNLFFINVFFNEVIPFIKKNNSELTDIEKKELNDIFEKRIRIVHSNADFSLQLQVLSRIDQLKNLFLAKENNNDKILRALRRVLHSEFYSELSPQNQNKTSKAQLFEGDILTFEFSLLGNEIKELKAEEILFFDDITFIESPIVLQMYDMINSAATLLELSEDNKLERIGSFSKAKAPLHLKDLIAKLENAQYFSLNNSQQALLEKISTIIEGGFSFEKQEKDFSFSKKNGKKDNFKIKSVNTASGIKSFGIIQLLIQAGVIDTRSLLIIDEPETHLHPKWQVEYARLLVELTKNDISILITSHSPYLIRALKVFSDKENIADRTAFYLAEKNQTDDFSEINDVTNNLNKLFSKLADPLKELL